MERWQKSLPASHTSHLTVEWPANGGVQADEEVVCGGQVALGEDVFTLAIMQPAAECSSSGCQVCRRARVAVSSVDPCALMRQKAWRQLDCQN